MIEELLTTNEKTPLEVLVERGIQESNAAQPLSPYERQHLRSLIRQSEIETGERPKSFGETMEGSIASAVHSAIKIPLSAWKGIGRVIADRKQDFEFDKHFSKKWPEEKLKAKGLDADVLRLQEIRQKEYEIYKKENRLAVDVPDSTWHKIFNAPYEEVKKAIDVAYLHRPDLQNEPIEGMADLIKNPRKLVGAIIESVPTLAAAGIATGTGHPLLSFSIMFAAEGNEAYEEAIADGASEDEAMQAFKIYGLASAAIEMVQVGQAIKFLKQIGKHFSAPQARKVLTNQVAKKVSKQIASKGEKTLTRQWLETAAKEAAEEASQGQIQEWTQRYVYGKKQEGGLSGWINRRGVEAMIAFGMTAPMGIPAIGIDVKGGQMRRSEDAVKHNEGVMGAFSKEMGLEDSDYAVPQVLGRQHRNIEKFVQAVFGKRVVWYVPYTKKAGNYNGWASKNDSGSIVLNAAMEDPMSSVSFHEVVHQMENNDAPAYNELKNTVFEYVKNMPEIQKDITNRFGRVGLQTTPQDIESEVVAEIVGRLAQDQNFLDTVAGRAPNALVRLQHTIIGGVKRALTKKATLAEDRWIDPFVADMAELSDRVAIALHNYGVKVPVLPPVEVEIAQTMRANMQKELETLLAQSELENQGVAATSAGGVSALAPETKTEALKKKTKTTEKSVPRGKSKISFTETKNLETKEQRTARLKAVFKKHHPAAIADERKKIKLVKKKRQLETREEKMERLKTVVKQYHPRPSVARLPFQQEKLSKVSQPATNLKQGMQYNEKMDKIRKGWIVEGGQVLQLKPLDAKGAYSKYGMMTWEHFDHARSIGETTNSLVSAGVVRVARFAGSRANEIVFEFNPRLMTPEKYETMLDFARQNSVAGEVNHITVRTAVGRFPDQREGYGIVNYSFLSEVKESLDEAIKSANLAMDGRPSIARRRTVKQQIHVATGFKKQVSPQSKMTEEEVMKLRYRAEQKTSKLAYQQGLRDMREKLVALRQKYTKFHNIRRVLIDWVKKDIPPAYRHRMMSVINNAKTERTVDLAVEKLSRTIDDVLRREELANLKRFMSKFRKKYGYRKAGIYKEGARFRIDPKFSIVFERIFDSISTKRALSEGQVESIQELIDYVEQEREAAELALEQGQTTEDNFYLNNEIIPTLERLNGQLAKQSVVKLDAETLRDLTNSMETLLAQYEWEHNEDPNSYKKQEEANDAVVHPSIITEVQQGWRKPIAIQPRDVQSNDSPYKIKRLWTGLFGRFNYNLATLSYIISGARKGWLYHMFGNELGHSRDTQKQVTFDIQDFVRSEMDKAGIKASDIKRWSRATQIRRAKLPKSAEKWISEHSPEALKDYVERPMLDELTLKLESGQTVRMSVGEALNIIMLVRSNPYQYRAIIDNGIVFQNQPTVTYKFNANDLQALKDTMPEKSKSMAKIFDLAINILQDKINDVSVKIDGYQKANIDGYWHIRRFKEKEPKGKEATYAIETIDNRSHWKERTGGNAPIQIVDAMNEFVDTVQVSAEYIGMSVGLRRAKRILKNKAILQTVREKGYEDYWNDMVKLIDATQDRKGEQDFITSLYGKWIQNVTRAVFAFNLRVAAQQYASVFMALNDFNIKHLKAIRFLPDKKLEERITKWSPFLRERFQGHVNRELGDAVAHGGTMRFYTGHDQLVNYPTYMVTWFDKLAIMDMWRMAESETMDLAVFKGRSKEDLYNDKAFMEKAMNRAEEAIRNTQPTWDVIDRSLIGSTKNPLTRSVTMFHSQREKMAQMFGIANSRYMNDLYQIQQRNNLPSMAAAAATKDGLIAMAKAAKGYGLILANIGLVKLFAMAYTAAIYGEPDEDPYAEWATGVVADIPGMFYFGEVGRDVITRWSANMRKKPVRPYMYELAPYRVVSTFGAAVGEAGKLVIMNVGPENYTDAEVGDQLYKVLDRTWEAAQYGTGMPFLHLTTIAKKRLGE